MDHGNTQDPTPPAGDNQDIHHTNGHLTRQLPLGLPDLQKLAEVPKPREEAGPVKPR